MISASMPLSMNHSPMEAPAKGARYWLVAESEAVAETTMVYGSAPVCASVSITRATFAFFWPTAT